VSDVEELLERLGSDGDRRDPRLVYASAFVRARRLRRRRRLTVLALPLFVALVAVVVWVGARSTPSSGSLHVAAPSAPTTTPATGAVVSPLQPVVLDPGAAVVSLRKNHSGTLVLQPLDGGAVRSVQLPDPNVQAIRPTDNASGLLVVVGPVDSGQVWTYDQAALHGQTGPVLIRGAVNAYPNPPGKPGAITAVFLTAGRYQLQQISADGQSLSPLTPIPEGFTPQAVVTSGVVLAGTTAAHQPSLEVWNPGNGAVIADLGTGHSPILMDTGGSIVAWRTADGDGHEVHLYDTATQHDTVVPVGDATAGFEGDQPTISPDGTRLAFGLETSPQAFAVGILNTVDHTLLTTPATTTPPSYFWSTDNTWLFAVDQNGLTAHNIDGHTSEPLATTTLTRVVDPTAAVRNQ
jgi:hypothetical protein